MRCPGCHNQDLEVFFQADGVPVFCNVLHASSQQALAAPRAEISLAFCSRCGLIHNAAFDGRLVKYSGCYENSLHFSPRFQDYAEKLARRLIARYRLRGKNIVEIGCGRGEFLEMLCEMGENVGVGFEPGHDGQTHGQAGDRRIRIVPQAYTPAHGDCKADFVCCRHVLEHIAAPLEFLSELRRSLLSRSDIGMYFEVPNALYTLQELAVWDIIYEHCCYFIPFSLRRLFLRAGFAPASVGQAYQDQFLAVEGLSARSAVSDWQGLAASEAEGRLVRSFAEAYGLKVSQWRRTLLRLHRRKAATVVWGGGSKGVTFLNVLKIPCEDVGYVVDLNPRKHGKFVPGTGQQIVPPEFLRRFRPQTVLVMNPIYLSEIRAFLQNMSIRSRLLVA